GLYSASHKSPLELGSRATRLLARSPLVPSQVVSWLSRQRCRLPSWVPIHTAPARSAATQATRPKALVKAGLHFCSRRQTSKPFWVAPQSRPPVSSQIDCTPISEEPLCIPSICTARGLMRFKPPPPVPTQRLFS